MATRIKTQAMKIEYKEIAFHNKTLSLINRCIIIIENYQAQGYRLTLRQLYYQLVSRNIITNTERSYQNLSRMVSNGRLAGLIDWNAIEDRIRVPRIPLAWTHGARDYVSAHADAYRLDRNEGQTYHIELWVEKDALAGVLAPIAEENDITLLVNRGYSSQSAMWESAERLIEASDQNGKECVLLYLGDLDPSGEDMVRDIRDRLNDIFGSTVDVIKLAITPEQVAQYNPPPNSTKMSDSRARAFVAEHGSASYEVDALPPPVLNQIVTDAISEYVDPDIRQERLDMEQEHRKLIREAALNIPQQEPA